MKVHSKKNELGALHQTTYGASSSVELVTSSQYFGQEESAVLDSPE